MSVIESDYIVHSDIFGGCVWSEVNLGRAAFWHTTERTELQIITLIILKPLKPPFFIIR
jgi:hypothetical protein